MEIACQGWRSDVLPKTEWDLTQPRSRLGPGKPLKKTLVAPVCRRRREGKQKVWKRTAASHRAAGRGNETRLSSSIAFADTFSRVKEQQSQLINLIMRRD
ncbi:hypothetical protein AOLI_G00250230 [Acnodon oligacanthus]